MGLRQVLVIIPSISASYHILSAPAAPAPIATKNNDKDAFKKSGCVGAITIPTNAVNITKDITLGFISSKKLLNMCERVFTEENGIVDICFFKVPLLII
jgi:hypothetical protein